MRLQACVIKSAQPDWSILIALVPRMDGTPRFCVNHWRLNSTIIPDTYRLPRMNDCIHNLGESKALELGMFHGDTGKCQSKMRTTTKQNLLFALPLHSYAHWVM